MTDMDGQPLRGETIAVIGAGIAGLAAARGLAKAGAVVTVFEKSRGLGGRLATRRIGDGAADHGAQYITAREPAFKAWTARAKALGAAAPWSPVGKDGDDEWLVGMPGMSGLAHALVDGFTVETGREVASITPGAKGYDIAFAGDTPPAPVNVARIVVAVPGPQAARLVKALDPAFEAISTAVMAPCWTLIASIDPAAAAGIDLIRAAGSVAWACRSTSRPGRSGDFWVVQADPDWSRRHLELDRETAAAELVGLFAGALGTSLSPTFTTAHRWRYALVEKAVGQTFLLGDSGRIGICGDWLIAPRVEAAWTSGDSLAQAMAAGG